MPTFSYSAVDARGQQKTGTLNATDTADATTQIKQQGLFPTRVVETGSSSSGSFGSSGGSTRVKKGGGKVKSKVLSVFTRQLATLIEAGLPLLRSLNTLLKQERNPVLKKTIQSIAAAVESGSTFSEGLAQHPRIFNKLYVNMVKAGELGGVPELVLARLAEFQEKSEKVKGKVKSAMIYPAVVLFIAVLILMFLLLFIVPQFQKIFADMLNGAALPPLTQGVIDVSESVQHHYILILAGVAVLVVAYQMAARTPFGVVILDRVKLKAPILGDLVRKTSISRFSRTLGTLVSSGVPILQALNITRETAGNSVIANAIGKVHDSVKEGETIVEPLENAKVFPAMVISMIQVGEETGQLPDMLIKVAEVYDVEVDNAVASLTSLIEPIMIVFLALIVGTIVIALFMPLITIITTMSSQS